MSRSSFIYTVSSIVIHLVRRTRHAGHCWRSRDKLISDVLLWTPIYGRMKAGRPAQTYIQQLCKDTGCSLEDLPEAMNDREKWRERVRDIHASGITWWWWLLFIVCMQLNDLKNIKWLNHSIWPLVLLLKDNEEVLYISQSSRNGASPSNVLVSYPRHLLGVEFLPVCRDAVGIFYSTSWVSWHLLRY